MGMALTSCTVPAAGQPTFDLPDDEMEIGIGIHGEPGRRRVPLAPAREIAEMLVEPMLGDLDFTGGDGVHRLRQRHGRHAAARALPDVRRGRRDPGEGRGHASPGRWSGSYITSLDMAGCSVTLLKVDDELLRLWDAPVRTPACAGES